MVFAYFEDLIEVFEGLREVEDFIEVFEGLRELLSGIGKNLVFFLYKI